MNASMNILGIETSCDETAAAVVTGTREILADLVLSQLDEHRPYGGVVPEIAARSHLAHLPALIEGAFEEAGLDFAAIDGVAATAGPGLIGGVFVGAMTAKAIAAARGLPFVAVNHLEGHALTVRLCQKVDFPYLLLLVSGGHCQLLIVWGVGRYRPKLAERGGCVAPTGPAGSMLLFSSLLVHASPPNISPLNRTIVYLSLCHIDNHIRQFKRPEWIAHRDFAPIEPLADDCLMELVSARNAAAAE